MDDLYLIRLVRHGDSCLLEKYNNGWYLPFVVIEDKTAYKTSIPQLIINNSPALLIKDCVV